MRTHVCVCVGCVVCGVASFCSVPGCMDGVRLYRCIVTFHPVPRRYFLAVLRLLGGSPRVGPQEGVVPHLGSVCEAFFWESLQKDHQAGWVGLKNSRRITHVARTRDPYPPPPPPLPDLIPDPNPICIPNPNLKTPTLNPHPKPLHLIRNVSILN